MRGSRSGRPIMALLDLLGRRWTLRIIWELHRQSPIRTDPLAGSQRKSADPRLCSRRATLARSGIGESLGRGHRARRDRGAPSAGGAWTRPRVWAGLGRDRFEDRVEQAGEAFVGDRDVVVHLMLLVVRLLELAGLSASVLSRRRRSIGRLRAVTVSHAPGFGGGPARGQRSPAIAKASWRSDVIDFA